MADTDGERLAFDLIPHSSTLATSDAYISHRFALQAIAQAYLASLTRSNVRVERAAQWAVGARF
jgi:hypothetical protein